MSLAPQAKSGTGKRRTSAEISRLKEAMYEIVLKDQPMTVRQVFYRMVSGGLIAKTEDEYKRTVGRLLGLMRLNGELPFDWISDNTRWMRKPNTYRSLGEALSYWQQTFRRSLWYEQEAYVEIWLEKDALAGVLYEVTGAYDVPLMVTRGYASHSFLHAAAKEIARLCKPAFLYYLGDHDPSGHDITRDTEARLREFAPDADITFERIAVTERQIVKLKLPTRPTKKTDSRSKNFKGESVEVDAVPPDTLRALVQSAIVQHIDPNVLKRTERIETAERETLATFMHKFSGKKSGNSEGVR